MSRVRTRLLLRLLPGIFVAAVAVAGAAAQGAIDRFGHGCPTAGPPPALSFVGAPRIGGLLQIGAAPVDGTGPAALIFGFSRTGDGRGPLPRLIDPQRAPDCTQWIAFDVPVALPVFFGQTRHLLAIPDDPQLVGGRVFCQHVHASARANALGVAMSGAARLTIGEPRTPLRVMSYNIHHGLGMDGSLDLLRIGRVIGAQQPDLVALQEVDRGVGRSGGVDQAAVLGRLLGMHAVFGESIPLGSGSYGNALLARWPLEDVQVIDLPNPASREQRTILAARVVLPGGGRLRLFGTHYDHAHQATRVAGARATLQHTAASAEPVLLVGDLNAQPGSPTINELGRAFADGAARWPAPTFPADVPARRIDYVMLELGQGQVATAASVPVEPVASDHRPVVVDLELR